MYFVPAADSSVLNVGWMEDRQTFSLENAVIRDAFCLLMLPENMQDNLSNRNFVIGTYHEADTQQWVERGYRNDMVGVGYNGVPNAQPVYEQLFNYIVQRVAGFDYQYGPDFFFPKGQYYHHASVMATVTETCHMTSEYGNA